MAAQAPGNSCLPGSPIHSPIGPFRARRGDGGDRHGAESQLMLKLLFGAVVLALLLIAGLAVGLYHFWGWKGLIAFPVALLLLLWLAKALVLKAIRRFFMGLISMKGAVLQGASIEVHSVKPVAKQEEWDEPEEDDEDDPDEAEDPDTLAAQADEPADADNNEGESDADEAPEKPRHYFEIDLTISPAKAKCFRLWTPSELELTSAPRKGLEELTDDSVAELCDCQVWDGSKFVEDDPGKYEGAQRVKIVFAVETAIRTAHLSYYGNPLGPVSLPEWTPPAIEQAAPGH